MNALVLGGATLGLLTAWIIDQHGPTEPVAYDPAAYTQTEDVGAMTHEIIVDPETGDVTELSVISFID